VVAIIVVAARGLLDMNDGRLVLMGVPWSSLTLTPAGRPTGRADGRKALGSRLRAKKTQHPSLFHIAPTSILDSTSSMSPLDDAYVLVLER
jgi:hypothetical protein